MKSCGVPNETIVVRDGSSALDYLFATGTYAGRSPATLPRVVLLDLKLPKIDGLDVLRRIRGDERTRSLPVEHLAATRPNMNVVCMSGYNDDSIDRHGVLEPPVSPSCRSR